MAATLFGDLILLFQMACVIFLFAYLLSKSRLYGDVLSHRASFVSQLILSVIFGLFSIYGMSTGISFYTANVNIRDFGPFVAGFACGPYVGIGAGIIGLAYRLSMGGTNVYAVAIGPLVAGVIGGMVYLYNDRELASVPVVVLVTLITETAISAFALAIRIISGDPFQTVATVAVDVALPMIVMTTFATGIFCYILQNEIRERRIRKEKMQLEIEVESKRNLNTIINTIAYPVYVLDREHRLVLVNDSMSEFLGCPREEILGKTHRDFYTKKDADRHWEMVEAAYRTHTPREEEVMIIKPGGDLSTLISTSTMYTDASGEEYLVGVIQEITERKRMDDAVKELNARLRRAEKVAQFGHWEFHLDDGTVVASDGARNLYGLRSNDYTIREVQEIPLPECRPMLDNALKELIENNKAYNVEFRIRRKTDNALLFINSIAEYEPETHRVFGVIHDITERKRVEKNLRTVTRKLNLLSSITRHDILNQLMVLKGYLVLARNRSEDPELVDFLGKARKSTDTIEHQIVFTRDYEEIGMKEPVWQSVSMNLLRAKGTLDVEGVKFIQNPPDVEVYADPLFEKVFYNLIDNSLKYGKPALTTIHVSFRETDKGLTIVYEDDGTGIAEQDKKFLFNRGFGKNTGLGLFLVREILALTGITIEEMGGETGGARFGITVPKDAYRFRQESADPGVPL
jgi:PAS domain S-box-containing protein